MRAELALLAVVALAACSEPGAPYAIPSDEKMTVVLAAAETVSITGRSAAKRLELTLSGTPSGDTFPLTIISATYEYRSADGDVTEHMTRRVSPDDASPIERARTGLVNALEGSIITLSVDPMTGLVGVEGANAAREHARTVLRDGDLEESVRTVTDEAVDGVVTLLDDAVLLRGLQSAGFTAIPDTVLDPLRDAQRSVDVHIDGLGLTTVALRGRAGIDVDESPIVQVEGRSGVDASFRGEPGPSPHDAVGAVLPDSIVVGAETMYRLPDLRPLRGNVRISYAHTNGWRVERRVSFTLVTVE